jgi:hypothetical protein
MIALNQFMYCEHIFDKIVQGNCIDAIIFNCYDPKSDKEIKQVSAKMLSHFALNKKSLPILIEKNILGLFNIMKNNDSYNDDEEMGSDKHESEI